MNKSALIFFLNLSISGSVFYSCGKENVFSDITQRDDKQKAADDISHGNYDSAISLLQSYIAANPTDYLAQSMLANAYMLKAGISTLGMVVAINNNLSSASNDLYRILNAFPTGNQANISGIKTALSYLAGIPSSSLTTDQALQTTIANAALAFLMLSLNCVDPSTGLISPVLVSSMSLTDANAIYNLLVNVQTSLTDLGISQNSGGGFSVLFEMISQMTASGGATAAQQLVAYLLANA